MGFWVPKTNPSDVSHAVGAPEAFFAKSSKKHGANLVALRYPPVADPSDAGFPLERVRPHTDPTDVTVLLFEDGPRGLQVLPEGSNGANGGQKAKTWPFDSNISVEGCLGLPQQFCGRAAEGRLQRSGSLQRSRCTGSLRSDAD